jgi:AbrB family looped-hinge helix DNA binding protein
MNTVKVSPKFQVVIPKKARSRLAISAGDNLQVITTDGRIELVPLKSAKELRGIARGIDTEVSRDKSDRL